MEGRVLISHASFLHLLSTTTLCQKCLFLGPSQLYNVRHSSYPPFSPEIVLMESHNIWKTRASTVSLLIITAFPSVPALLVLPSMAPFTLLENSFVY